MREFPTRFYDIVKDVARNRAYHGKWLDPIYCDKCATIGDIYGSKLHQAKLLYAPRDLGKRIWNSYPTFINRDLLRLPYEHVFIEFASPVEMVTEDKQREHIWGIQIADSAIAKNDTEANEPNGAKGGIIVVTWYRSLPDNGKWILRACTLPITALEGCESMAESHFVINGLKVKNRWSLKLYLQLAAFILFMNSSNVAYELRSSPKMPRSKDKSWWKREYEAEFETLVVKTIPKRILMALHRNEAGETTVTPHWVRGHFKVLSYCASCARRKAIRRFLRKEVCRCGSSLEPAAARTQMFWWDGHLAGLSDAGS